MSANVLERNGFWDDKKVILINYAQMSQYIIGKAGIGILMPCWEVVKSSTSLQSFSHVINICTRILSNSFLYTKWKIYLQAHANLSTENTFFSALRQVMSSAVTDLCTHIHKRKYNRTTQYTSNTINRHVTYRRTFTHR